MSILTDLDTPIFYIEGEPSGISRANYNLRVEGLIRGGPRVFTFEEIEKMPFTSANARLTSVSGWSVRADWQGVKFSDFIQNFRLESEAAYVLFESFGGYTTCISLADLARENVLLCYKVGGEYIEGEYGGPLRLVVPHLWGYKSIKGLARIVFTDSYVRGYWESRGYTDGAAIESGITYDVNSKLKRKIRGGEVVEF